MSTVADEVYAGTRCAICEERFKPGEAQRGTPSTAERIHTSCWEGADEVEAMINAAYDALAEQYRQLGPPPRTQG